MNPAVGKLVAVGGGIALLVYFATRGKSGRITATAEDPQTKWTGDPSTCKCSRRVPVGVTATGATRYAVMDEPDWTLCVEDFSEADVQRCFSTTAAASPGLPAWNPRTIAAKTTDAGEAVGERIRAVWRALVGSNATEAAAAGFVAGATTEDVEGF